MDQGWGTIGDRATVARFLQSIIPAEQHEVYLDDSLWVLRCKLAARNRTLACILTTMAALGLKISLLKGERAAMVTWIGVKFKLVAPDIYDHLASWDKKGMIGASELRKAAGRVAWLAGILPRARWVTASTRTTRRRACMEAERRSQRKDSASSQSSALKRARVSSRQPNRGRFTRAARRRRR